MSRATKKFRVIFDSEGRKFFRMVLPDTEGIFQLSPNRLYYFDPTDWENSVLLLNTVSENREGFTQREYKSPWKVQRAMQLLGFPSERDFENMVRSNMIVNFPVTFSDVKNAKLIFGPDIISLKGKSVRRKLDSVVTDYVDIPREILKSRKELEVPTDIMFTNKLPFLVSISQWLKFTTIDCISSKNEIALVTHINKIVSYYISKGLHVVTMFLDPEFKSLEEKVVITTLNTTGACDHIPEVERYIQVIKERMRAHHTKLPFPIFTRHIAIDLAKHVVMFLNAFPPKSGLSKTYSPRKIMTGKSLDWKKSCKLHFRAYTQVHDDINVTNTLEERTQGEICLGPIGNLQGTYNFFSLRSGKKLPTENSQRYPPQQWS